MTKSVTHFASGSNHAGEIQGFAAVEKDLGVVAGRVKGDTLEALVRLEGTDTKVFVDSGAFSEVDFPGGVPTITKPMTEEKWLTVLGTYACLGVYLRDQLYVVAPDCVAHQTETLERLAEWADEVNDIRELGVNILCALQGGEMPLSEFAGRVDDILGTDNYVTAVPMMKSATSDEALTELLTNRKVERLHLLGIGPKSDRWDGVLELIERTSPDTQVFADSVLITSLVGRTNGPKGGPRALTQAQDTVRDELLGRLYGGEVIMSDTDDEGDYTDSIYDIDAWALPATRKCILRRLAELTGTSPRQVEGDLETVLETYGSWADSILDEAWQKQLLGKATVAYRKREGIKQVFGR